MTRKDKTRYSPPSSRTHNKGTQPCMHSPCAVNQGDKKKKKKSIANKGTLEKPTSGAAKNRIRVTRSLLLQSTTAAALAPEEIEKTWR